MAALAAVGMLCPFLSRAQPEGLAGDLKGLQGVLDQLYVTMLPQSSVLIGVGQGIAGFAALWFIGVRVWRHIANAEPIDVWPLLRPFAIGGVLGLYPFLIGLINGVMQPTVAGTSQMQEKANASIALLLQQKEEASNSTAFSHLFYGNEGSSGPLWELYAQGLSPVPGITNAFDFAMNKAYFSFRNTVKEWLSEVLEIVFQAAALCINALRTFQLIVLAILGPLVLGFSVFDGFQGSLHTWLARYICVFLWLPVANIFGAIIANIQAAMLQLDINQIQSDGGTYFGPADVGYLIFLFIGIIGYFTVPTVASYVVNAADSGALTARVNRVLGSVGRGVVKGAKVIVGAAIA